MRCRRDILDEISLFADNRDYKSFAHDLKQFFILHRHYHCDIIWFTQQYDGVDRKIRELTTCLYYVRAAGKLPMLSGLTVLSMSSESKSKHR